MFNGVMKNLIPTWLAESKSFAVSFKKYIFAKIFFVYLCIFVSIKWALTSTKINKLKLLFLFSPTMKSYTDLSWTLLTGRFWLKGRINLARNPMNWRTNPATALWNILQTDSKFGNTIRNCAGKIRLSVHMRNVFANMRWNVKDERMNSW